MHSTAKAVNRPKSKVTVVRTEPLTAPWMIRYLIISTAFEIGLTFAMALSQPGMDETGSRALLAKRSGSPTVLPTAARVSKLCARTESIMKSQRNPTERRVRAAKIPNRSTTPKLRLKTRPPGRTSATRMRITESRAPFKMLEISNDKVIAVLEIGATKSLFR